MKTPNITYDYYGKAYLQQGRVVIDNRKSIYAHYICRINTLSSTMIVTPNNFHQYIDEPYFYELLFFYCTAKGM